MSRGKWKFSKLIVLLVLLFGGSLVVSRNAEAVTTDEFISYARQYKGVPYVVGGRSPSGFDCCGFVWYICNHFGIDVGTGNQQTQQNYGQPVTFSKSSFQTVIANMQAGDLVFFDYGNDGSSDHVAIYTGNGNAINAELGGVLEHTMDQGGWPDGKMWQSVSAIRRVITTDNVNLKLTQTSSTSIRCDWDAVPGARIYFIEVINSSGERVDSIWTGYLDWTFNNLATGTYTVRLDVLDSNDTSIGKASQSIIVRRYEPVISDGEYHIVSKLNPSYGINTSYNSTESGANIQIYNNMSESDVNSLVKVTYLDMGCYKLEMTNSHKVIDAEGGGKTNGTNVQQYVDNGTDAQKWIIQVTDDGWFYIVSKLSGLYMEVAGGYLDNYTNVQLWEGNQTDAQKWHFIASGHSDTNIVEDGDYQLLSRVDPRYAAEISEWSQDYYANCQVYLNLEHENQIFTLEYQGNGYYSITAKHSGKVLEAEGGHTQSGSNVSQHPWNGSDAQKWIIRACNGGYEIINKASGLYLDLSGGVASNGTNIQVYYGNGTDSQKWLLEAFHEHQWGNPSYEWDNENNTLIATYTCMLDSAHTKTEVHDNIQALKLPIELQTIEEEAFAGLSCQVVIIPEGCTTIGSRAFADCDELLYVAVPSTLSSIASDAFEGCDNYISIE